MSITPSIFKSEYLPRLIQWRRYLHQHPELSWNEYETTQYIESELRSMGIQTIEKPIQTGLVATIEGRNPTKKCIALRADIDALPILEQNNCDYKSQNEGVMHACGHDVHTTCLLGAAHYLNAHKEDFEGTIKLIFQPSEEKQPSGAEAMIAAKVLEHPKVSTIIGLHVTPELEIGKIGYRKGQFMASADEIYLTIIGKGGHAASPHLCIDPIIISAQILVALQQLVSRYADPKTPTVLSFGDIHGYGATNIIPDKVEIKGTFRTFNEVWRKEMHTKIRSVCEGIASSFGAQCMVDIPEGLPFVYNHEEFTTSTVASIKELLGDSQVVEMPIRMGAEDFSYYGHQCPATFLRLGTGNALKGTTIPVHNSKFDIDEEALAVGSMTMAHVALSQLSD